MSAPSLAPYVFKRPWLQRFLTPLANWYGNAAGYRQLGLKADDLLPEENDTVLLALKRLPANEAYDRVFRLRRALQHSMQHNLLPKNEWTKPEDDTPYLSSIIKEIEREMAEREDLEAMVILKRAKNAGH
ncbi:14 kDa subunit of cytochrome bd ubiquinol oxidase [Periconia macrospinosa]|uniref:Cytochrome b-c1 complex subunit 7 n=1 Tax=Periconia macrospinosa TaxID=97972 RepID=A0A2V1ECU9_9PLEO|nr:14 kDa subunit of cytochrome bd ubiquinol oxidase [Periconia macrospinosa]